MQLPVRKENRLTYYDYSNDGRYYITICTRDKMCILWENPDITNGKVKLSEIGKIVSDELKKFPEIYDNLIYTSKYVIMPNHIHLIINIKHDGRRNAAPTISTVINQFKGCVSKKAGFSVWQKSFYDHIIRNDKEYYKICEYINQNPQNWINDIYYQKG